MARPLSIVTLILQLWFAQATVGMANTEDFSDIQNLFSDRCLQCHGPDESTREAGLRLDKLDGVMSVLEVGDHARSELFLRIISDDELDKMPPPEAKLELSPDEIETIKKWIDSGAPWQRHWAYEPLPVTVAVPVFDSDWVFNPIDAFVLKRLRTRQLEPQSEAERWQWLRRVSFDLTGMPPSSNEIDEFVSDKEQGAHERVVDRLLKSTTYGEHLAVAWLDAARYGDSYGYQSDMLNTQWPYRDWVVRAFNHNLRYDKFIKWQLAGDILVDESDMPNPLLDRERKLATAFNRLHRMNNEGGAVFKEWKTENIADRVNTFGTAVLGLTVECARCHDHKFDPMSQRDYYSLFAFFNSIDENGMYDKTAKVPSPTMLLPNERQAEAMRNAALDLQQSTDELMREMERIPERWKTWRSLAAMPPKKDQGPTIGASNGPMAATDSSASFSLLPATPILSHDYGQSVTVPDTNDFYPSTDDRARAQSPPFVAAKECDIPRINKSPEGRMAVKLDGDVGFTYTQIASFDRWTPFSLALTIKDVKRSPLRSLLAHHSRGTDAGYNGWDLTIIDGYLESRLYRVWPGNAIGVRTKIRVPQNQWSHVTATFDGSSQAQGLKIYLDGGLLETEVLRDKCLKQANVAAGHGGQFVVGQRFRSRGFTDGLIESFQLFDVELSQTEVAHFANGSRLIPTLEFFALRLDERAIELRKARQASVKAFVMSEESVFEIPIMEDLPQPVPAHVLGRGRYDAATSEKTLVSRRTFAEIGPEFNNEFRSDRLGLADWTLHPGNPLTARVFVNRIWMNFFGKGLVATPEDFGVQGARPSHPDLLDWLARSFIDDGWDIKALCKRIALSRTYRQSSRSDPTGLQADPDNQWYSRGAAYRLSAEQIRDLALAASGLLNREMSGPPVSPYQAGGDLWRESNGMSPAYRQSVGRALYRRSLYSVVKRTAPLPNMTAFDSGSREVCSVYRSRTNTPLQAMVLLNDVQYVEAARSLAEKVLTSAASDNTRLRSAFKLLTARQPDDQETELLTRLLSDERKHYRDDVTSAKSLCDNGESKYAERLDVVELAAWTTVCQAIMNLDATVWKR